MTIRYLTGVAAIALLTGCGSTLKTWGTICADPYGPAPDAPPQRGRLNVVLAPVFTDAELDEARAACADWADAGVACDVHRDADDVPDRGALPVARCARPRYAEGSTATTYVLGRSASIVVIGQGARLHRRLLAHELGHALGILGSYAHRPCTQSSILGASLTCMSERVSPADGCAAKAKTLLGQAACYGEGATR